MFCINCKKHCPAFPADLNYLPYLVNQELKFINYQNDISNFIISYKNNSKANSYDWNCACSCEASSVFKTYQNQDSLRIECSLIIGGSDDNAISYGEIDCCFKYSFHYSDNFAEVLLAGQQIPYDKLSKYLSDTISIENENNKIIKKVVIVKGKGLVSYTTVDGEEWRLIE